MSAELEKGHPFGSVQIKAGEQINRLGFAPVRHIIAYLNGCPDSEAYAQLDWRTAKQIPQELVASAWVELPGDPESGRFPFNQLRRNWRNAAVYGARRAIFDHIKLNQVGKDLQPAVSFWYGFDLHVAKLPEGRDFVPITDDYRELVGAALRRGPNDAKFTLGLWDDEQQRLYEAHEVQVVEAAIKTADLINRFPDITLG